MSAPFTAHLCLVAHGSPEPQQGVPGPHCETVAAVSILVVGESIVDRIWRTDGTVLERVGGSALNVAVALGRLGHDVELLTALGDDAHGTAVREHAAASSVR